MPKPTLNKRPGPGRPKLVVDLRKAIEHAGLGMTNDEVCRALGISMASWMRWLRQDDNREKVQKARSQNIRDTLVGLKQQAIEHGKTGAASYLLGRLERRVKLSD